MLVTMNTKGKWKLGGVGHYEHYGQMEVGRCWSLNTKGKWKLGGVGHYEHRGRTHF